MTDDAAGLGEQLEEIAVHFEAAQFEHVLNEWMAGRVSLYQVATRMAMLRQEFELLELVGQGPRLELAVKLL